jgi:hypothetical protein
VRCARTVARVLHVLDAYRFPSAMRAHCVRKARERPLQAVAGGVLGMTPLASVALDSPPRLANRMGEIEIKTQKERFQSHPLAGAIN